MRNAHARALTWQEVWELHGIKRGTLKSWVHRGYLAPVAVQGRTHLYLEADVLECERARRQA